MNLGDLGVGAIGIPRVGQRYSPAASDKMAVPQKPVVQVHIAEIGMQLEAHSPDPPQFRVQQWPDVFKDRWRKARLASDDGGGTGTHDIRELDQSYEVGRRG